MSCKFKIVEDLYRETEPKLADFLNEKGLQVWSLIKNSKLFKAKDGKYSLSPVTTAKRQKQIEFIDSLEDFVYLDGEDVVVDLLKVEMPQNTSLTQGLNWAQKIMPDLKIELIEDLVDNVGKGAYNSVSDLITLSKKYADKKTVKHEVFHKSFNNSSEKKREELLNEGSKLFNLPRGENKIITKYSKAQQNEINYVLKAVDILQSEKAKQVFEKGEKAKWDLDKILTELQVPREQKTLILGVLDNMPYYEEIPFNEQLALELADQYSYVIDINIAKLGNKTPHPFLTEDNPDYLENTPNESIGNNTQYYSNLTVPGGTNYTENEISTPLITPNIKGHAQFSTDSGIGWTRTDEKIQYTEQDIDFLIDTLEKSGQLEVNCK